MSEKAQNNYGIDPGVWSGQEDLPVGALLKKARDHYGLSIEDVERALRIRASHLVALEEGRIDRLPGRVYAIGFVRSYAEYLGLDGGRVVSKFKNESGGSGRERPELTLPVPASESRLPDIKILLPSFAGLVLIIALVAFLSGGNDRIAEIPSAAGAEAIPVSGGMAELQMPMESALAQTISDAGASEGGDGPMRTTAESVIANLSAAPDAMPAPTLNRVVITAIENAWTEIRNAEGKVVLSRILKAGDVYTIPDEEGMTLSTGNAGGLVFTVDGKPGIMIGKTGDILRKVSIHSDGLAARGAYDEMAAAKAASLAPVAADAPASPIQPVKTPPVRTIQKRKASPQDEPLIVRTPRDREGM